MAIDLQIVSQGLVKLTGFAVIIVISFVIGRVAGRLIERILHELEIDKIFRRNGKKWKIEEIIGIIIRYAIYIAGIVIALDYIGLYYALSRFIIVIVGLIIAAFLLLEVKDFIPNFIEGIARKKMMNGMHVEFDGIKGSIIARRLTGYRIRTMDNDTIFLPYSQAK